MKQCSLTFIGAGNMARALLTGLAANDYSPSLITVCAPTVNHRQGLAERFGINSTDDNRAAAQAASVIIIAVKPQRVAAVCDDLQGCNLANKLILSVATGVTLAYYGKRLGDTCSIIRAMPNTPATVGYAVTGLYAPPPVSLDDKQFTENLFRSVGQISWLNHESAINAVIAAAGSAPAYFFQWMHAMQEEANRLGLSEQQSRDLVQYTALGAAQMAIQNSELSLQTLSDQIASKGGTTEAALAVFQQQRFNVTIAQAMQAAVQRAAILQQALET